jgi:hypothetical protein
MLNRALSESFRAAYGLRNRQKGKIDKVIAWMSVFSNLKVWGFLLIQRLRSILYRLVRFCQTHCRVKANNISSSDFPRQRAASNEWQEK